MTAMISWAALIWFTEWTRRLLSVRALGGAWRSADWRRGLFYLSLQDVATVLGACLLVTAFSYLPGGSAVFAAAWITCNIADGMLFGLCELRLQGALWRQRRELHYITAHPQRLICGLSALGAVSLLLGAWLPAPSFASKTWLLLSAAALGLGLGARQITRVLPPGMQHAWTSWLFWASPARPASRGLPLDAAALLAEHESFSPVDPAYPLLRITRSFKGERLIDVRGLQESKPHIIVIYMESFRGKDVGALGGAYNATPRFDQLAAEGALWTRFYTHGHSSSRALLSGLYGVLPGDEIFPTRGGSHGAPLIGLPHIAASMGYVPHYFTNGPLQFEDNGNYLLDRGFAAAHGRVDIRRRFPEVPCTTWGPLDEYLMAYHLEWLQGHDAVARPTFSTLFTMTHHDPYEAPKGTPLPDSSLPLPGGVHGKFLHTMHYADACLGNYVDALRRAGLEKKVVLWVMGDTGQQLDTGARRIKLGGYLRDEAYHVPLLLWAPGFLREPCRVNRLSGQADLLPGMLDLLQLDHPHHSMGTSLLRSGPERPVAMHQPFVPVRESLRTGAERFNCTEPYEALSLYSIDQDPAESRDLAPWKAERVQHLRRLSHDLQNTAAALHREHRFVSRVFITSLQHAAVVPAIPRTLLEAQARLASLQKAAGGPDGNAILERIFRAYLGAALDDAERLEFLQLRLKRHYGWLSSHEGGRLEVLSASAQAQALRHAAQRIKRAER